GDVRAIPLVTLGVNLTADAAGWTARPDDPANRPLVLTLRGVAQRAVAPRVPLTGTVQGFAMDVGTILLPFPTGRRVTFGDTGLPISGFTTGSPLIVAVCSGQRARDLS